MEQQGERKSENSLDITAKCAEVKDLEKKQGTGILVEELPEDDNFKSPSIEHLNSKFGSSLLIEEPTSDVDLDEHEVKKQNQLSVSRGVSIVSLTSDDESSLKAGPSKDINAEEALPLTGSSSHVPLTNDPVSKEQQKGNLFDTASCEVQNDGLTVFKSTSEEAKPQKGKLVEKASAIEVKDNIKEAQVTSPALRAEKGLHLKTCEGEEADFVAQKPKMLLGEQVDVALPLKGQRTVEEYEEDPTVEALLQRVRKQRSVLEEILEKEEERKCEGKGCCWKCKKKEVRKS